ncbi:MAG: hypothetical protein WA664_08265 [Candidatus Acidiferrales bacterium]
MGFNRGFNNGFNRGFNHGFNNGFGRGFGRGFNRGFGFHQGFGCWGCGFGWGFGFGWGWGWGGWWDPWWGPGWGLWGPYYGYGYPWWGYPAYSYPYPVYPNYDVTYPAPYSGTDEDDDSSLNSTPSDDYFQRPSFGGTLNFQSDTQGYDQGSPNTNAITGNVAASTPTVLLYLKDGTMYTASDYWLVDNKLHYVTSYSTESIVDMDEVDLQRTVDENSKRGVTFTLKARPNGPTPAPSAAPGSGTQPNGTASSAPSIGADGRSEGATPAASPAPERPIPAPRLQETSETQTY